MIESGGPRFRRDRNLNRSLDFSQLGIKSSLKFNTLRQSNESITNSIRAAKDFHRMKNSTLTPSTQVFSPKRLKRPAMDIIGRKRNFPQQLYNSIDMNKRSFKKNILNGSLIIQTPVMP